MAERAWGRPDPAVAAVRYAVRACLASLTADLGSGDGGSPKLPPLVLVACSGGADSLALAEALAFEARASARQPGSVRAGAVVIDHGLQPDSAQVAEQAAATCRGLGLDPVEVVAVSVTADGSGIEAAARDARYAALTEAASRLGAVAVLLGHTRDDQAEQVLLGLTRGSGSRSLSGMPPRRAMFARPLLGVSRAQTRAACAAEGLEFWDDPMNDDPSFTRVRARKALADLERDLGPGIVAALARSADQLRADADLLETIAAEARQTLEPGPAYDSAVLAAMPDAIRSRVWRMLLIDAGAPAGALSSTHTTGCDRLVTDWRGQGPIQVPGRVVVSRSGPRVHITPHSQVE